MGSFFAFTFSEDPHAGKDLRCTCAHALRFTLQGWQLPMAANFS